jgi:hemerythrin-like domain-containing protein
MLNITGTIFFFCLILQMENIKPLKRSKELAPLSREHHDGLLFVWKIRQGLANGTSLAAMCDYTKWFWTNHIKPHFKDEEKVLVKFLPDGNPMVNQMIDEHKQIRDMILTLDKEPDKNSLEQLADFLNNHIRFEERELFAYAEKELTPDQLHSIYQQLAAEPYCDREWKDEFWTKK